MTHVLAHFQRYKSYGPCDSLGTMKEAHKGDFFYLQVYRIKPVPSLEPGKIKLKVMCIGIESA